MTQALCKPWIDRRKDASVKVEEDWEIVREIEFNQLAPLRTSDLPEAEDLYECGSVETYDLSYDRITPKVAPNLFKLMGYIVI